MPDSLERGPAVPDKENAYRAILYPHWWVEDREGPSSAAFDDPVFSVDIASRTTPIESANRFRNVNKIAEFNCGEARGLGFDTRDEPDELHPDNNAHAHVYFEDYDELGKKKRKRRIRHLIEICRVIDC